MGGLNFLPAPKEGTLRLSHQLAQVWGRGEVVEAKPAKLSANTKN